MSLENYATLKSLPKDILIKMICEIEDRTRKEFNEILDKNKINRCHGNNCRRIAGEVDLNCDKCNYSLCLKCQETYFKISMCYYCMSCVCENCAPCCKFFDKN